ncbi:Flp family type IVb pilin [Croceicoccus sediminis]|uniref:Flp family type IVb pilin n=1 Tax=Croceicoccus sediminis TaxID=2571150 RepID=UPI001181F28A|nr:Flp family type IVb pilin [Croceicoccus sediminis]
MLTTIAKFRDDENGATAIEYGLIVALIGIAMMVGLNGVAGATNNMWTYVADSATEAMQKAG